ncbi:transmembrane protein, putative (macronuclear) [Tetrahymena thermophila SB210]|uniref:Transmembrane protein, putative n=1 Tax=Tetrahymena thermophila (strain SB210) TaxID=312017 RepID=Q24FP5_TETTS|nr:transmembrane protein, putative [Tetrahymena thermophila SB210]EAS06599.2 transmembrane protein, putative [Tetrahymena thermophila SB210]|eukprot:XP_001026844.2 transmembrane protein, putative [Tetrahymena thermophila SB210]
MKINQKALLSTIAGVAIAAGAGLYMYKRQKTKQNQMEHLIQKLCEAAFGDLSSLADINQDEIRSLMQQSFASYVGAYLIEREKKGISSEAQTQLKIKNFFKFIIESVIDAFGEFLFYSQHIEKTENLDHQLIQDQGFEKYNFVINLVFNLISQFLQDNKLYSHLLSQILTEGIDQPTRYLIGIDSYELFEQKFEDKNHSIFEYILIHQSRLFTENINILVKILDELGNQDAQFLRFINLKFLKLIKFAIKQVKQESEQVELFKFTELSSVCSKLFSSEELITSILIQNEYIFINIANIIKDCLQKSEQNLEIIQTNLLVLKNLFYKSENLKQFNRIDDLVEILLDCQEILFENIQIYNQNGQDSLQFLIQNSNKIIQNIKIQKDFYELFYNLSYFSCVDLAKNKKNNLINIMCTKYRQFVEKFYDQSQQISQNIREDKNYIGFSICNLLVFITLISQGPDLNTNTLVYTLESHFQYQNQQELDQFVNKIAYLLHTNLLYYSFHYNSQLLNQFENQQNSKQNSNINDFWDLILSAESGVYDLNTFTYQLISSIQSSGNQLIFKYVSHYHFQFRNQAVYEQVQILKPQIVVKNMIYDQTPLLNIDYKLNQIISRNNKEIQEKKYFVIRQIIRKILFQNKDKNFMKEKLVISAKQYINNEKLIDEVLKEFNFKEGQLIKINEQDLDYSYDILNTGRSLYCSDQSNIIKSNVNVLKKTQFFNLFKHQQDLIVNSFTNEYLIELFIEKLGVCSINDDLCKDMILTFDFYIYTWAELIEMLQNQQNLLTQQQKLAITSLKENILSEYSQSLLSLHLKNLIDNFNGRQEKAPLGAQNLQLFFSNHEKSESKKKISTS